MYSICTCTSLFFCIRSKRQDHVAVCQCVEILEESGKLTEYRRVIVGISFKTQALQVYVLVFITRYMSLFTGEWILLYNTVCDALLYWKQLLCALPYESPLQVRAFEHVVM